MPITINLDWSLDVHHILAELGYDLPEAFAFPDIFVGGITEPDRLRWAFVCREILMLPIAGAYREIVVELSRQLEVVGRFRDRMRVLTAAQ